MWITCTFWPLASASPSETCCKKAAYLQQTRAIIEVRGRLTWLCLTGNIGHLASAFQFINLLWKVTGLEAYTSCRRHTMLVHITLDLHEADADAQSATIVAALNHAGVREIDSKFLKRYSLVSGHVDEADLQAVAALPMVLAVEPDGTVTTS